MSEITWGNVDSFIGNSSSHALASYRPCPVCNSVRSNTVFQHTGFQFYTDSSELPKRADVKETQCVDCFAVYLNPCYSSYGLEVLFEEAGCSYGSTPERQKEQIEWLSRRKLLPSGACVLDAGCYDGRFLAQMPTELRKVGVDIDQPAIDRGRTMFSDAGIEFLLGDFEFFHCDSQPDVVTMFHVLEHLRRPASVLRNLGSLVHANSRLVVEVPILENGCTNDINSFFSIQHMTHFSRQSLKNVLSRAGWEVMEWQEQDDYNGCRVLAGPAKECIPKGDVSDIGALHRCLASVYQAARAVEQRVESVRDVPRLIIWGAGAHLECLYHLTSLFRGPRNRHYLLLDGDPLKHDRSWRGLRIHDSAARLDNIDWQSTRLLVSSYGNQQLICDAARDQGVPPDRIVTLYDDLRVY